jgi:hypothetical protein
MGGRIDTNDVAEMGELLSIAAAINEDVASELASPLSVPELVAKTAREQNLGRQAILVRGLHAASRLKCLALVEKLYGDEAHEFLIEALDSNERVNNIVHLIINLQKIAPGAADRLLQIAIQSSERIITLLNMETDLTAASQWLRTTYGEAPVSIREFQAQVVHTMAGISQYEERLLNFIEGTLALIDIGRPADAAGLVKRFADTDVPIRQRPRSARNSRRKAQIEESVLCARQNGDGIAKEEKLRKSGNQILGHLGNVGEGRSDARAEEAESLGSAGPQARDPPGPHREEGGEASTAVTAGWHGKHPTRCAGDAGESVVR